MKSKNLSELKEEFLMKVRQLNRKLFSMHETRLDLEQHLKEMRKQGLLVGFKRHRIPDQNEKKHI